METTLSKATPFVKNVKGDKGKGVATSSWGLPAQSSNTSEGQARMLALTPQDAQTLHTIVTSTLFVFCIEALVLFDLK